MKDYNQFLNENKFEVGDECYFRVGYKLNHYWKIIITAKGRNDDDDRGYRYKLKDEPGSGWSSRENDFLKEKPAEPKRIYSAEDPYGEEDWDDEIFEN